MTLTRNGREQEIEELKAGLARLRGEIAALSHRANGSAGVETGEKSRTDGQREAGNTARNEADEQWADVRKSFDGVRHRGEQLLKDLAALIERHPVEAAATAFGLGFIIAKLMGQGGYRDKGRH
jgi:predicted  nucleic acid-binding Zn-ribbon protein